ncbi:hypothetical protein GY45DRAFT_1060043 [Cubamyces sp. BRFM 1775]|nr:hypothetical protein GY45DRAFT_1060043 [Cubamyces sp. BRFM 1775]
MVVSHCGPVACPSSDGYTLHFFAGISPHGSKPAHGSEMQRARYKLSDYAFITTLSFFLLNPYLTMTRRPVRPRRSASPLITTMLLLATVGTGIRAIALQSRSGMPCTNATYSWMSNVDGVSPCSVLSALLGAQSQPPCYCNVVSYSLRAACTLCMPELGEIMQTLQQYTAGRCGGNDDAIDETFPCTVPSQVAIPIWAYQAESVVVGVFNVTLASQVALFEPTPSPEISNTSTNSATQTLPTSPSRNTPMETSVHPTPCSVPRPRQTCRRHWCRRCFLDSSSCPRDLAHLPPLSSAKRCRMQG